ncbi:TPA: hypothetical protein NVL90_001379 [Klebsiella oxytoca]|nr:hypothetical protein [Klebsiella oxytoca]HCJ7378755.1 hypothetical protein [Klebsiella oxytoca]HDX4249461.1 hypothetical protein [Klebsiella oxytoca]
MTTEPMTTELNSPDGLLNMLLTLQGGACQQLFMTRSDGSRQPIFYRAHWLNNLDSCASQPPLMRQLGGEWVGVPFGHGDDGKYFQPEYPHGMPANSLWHWRSLTKNQTTMGYCYPESYPLRELERTIILSDDGQVFFSLRIEAREDCALPVGLHPIFPFGGDWGPLHLLGLDDIPALSYPSPPEAGVSKLLPLQPLSSIKAAPTSNGELWDLTHLPLPAKTEEIVQLLPPIHQVGLEWPRLDLQVTLDWDTEWLPYCLLWFSNGGREYAPWDGRNYCLGIEPIHSAWDSGPGAVQKNLLSEKGFSTTLSLKANKAITIKYHLTCTLLQASVRSACGAML